MGLVLKSNRYKYIYSKMFNIHTCFKKAISHKHVLSGSSDKTIKLWDMNTCECIKTFMGHSGPVTTIIKLSHPNNNLIASGSFDKTIRIWNLISEQCLRIIQAHQEFVRCLLALGKNII
jgi:WD40 repeat protein